jgi:RHS repeat-associated protein
MRPTFNPSYGLVNTYAYDPYGKIMAQQETVPQPFKYAGQVGIIDEGNNLYYMRARYYDANIGRFISEDPAGFQGGLNLYAYVGGNPIMLVDPSGLGAERASTFIGNIGGYVKAAYQNINFPDYYSVSIPTLIPFVGVNVTVDQYGSAYVGPGLGIGYPSVGLASGWKVNTGHSVWNTPNPAPEELNGFLTGWGYSMGAGVGLNWTTSDQALSVMTPGLGASYSWQIW